MKNPSARLILGFFSTESGEPQDAYQGIARTKADVCLFQADGTTTALNNFCSPYAGLRLAGESMVVARADSADVPAIIDILRTSGSPAVFALRAYPASSMGGPAPSAELTPKERIIARLKLDEERFNTACRDLEEALRLDHALTAAAEWLLDNAYLVRTHVGDMQRLLPRQQSRVLRALGSNQGYTRLYALARELVRRTDCALNEQIISDCLRDYQAATPLSMAELWIFPLLLRLALIDALASLATGVNRSQQLREAAYLWANRLAGSSRTEIELNDMLARMETEPFVLEPYFIISLAEQLQDEENALGPAQHWIEDRLKTPLHEIVQAEHTREAAERIATANAFGSLRMLSRLDFAEVFESISLVEAELRRDPAGIYARSDFATRDECRHVVEQIARHSGTSEIDVARRAIALASAATDPQVGHVAYYLLSKGVKQLEADTHTRVPAHTRLIRGVRHHATPAYLASVVLLTACFTGLAITLARDAGAHSTAALAILATLALFPLSELTTQIVNALVISLLPPKRLPKMDFRDHIPEEHATLVVIPMMLSSIETVHNELEKLEVRYLANTNQNLFFSLFSDFKDADTQTTPDDEALIDTARAGIADLNQRYPGERFLLFHRLRLWSKSEQRWIGRERKRGKIDDLNAYLCGDRTNDVLNVGRLPLPIRYVITLDADTQLPPETGRRLVETIAHPLNRVQIDPATGVRRGGFSIIQPRVSIALPDATATRFTRVFADAHGTDPYCSSVSDAHQDLFEEAIFHGKAIFEVAPMCSILKDRFPEETLLSHDLIEGAHVGVGLATDIELFENLPLNYSSYSKREHRWVRGDWQIAPWIFPRVPLAGGRRMPNPLSALNRWKIFDNLRRSLVPLASMLLLLFGWLISATPGIWSLVVGLAVAIPALTPLLERWARRVQGAVHGWQGAADELIRTMVVVAFLPHQAWLSVDAIVRALYRSRVSGRNLLEWQTADSAVGSHARRQDGKTLRQLIVIFALSMVLMIGLDLRGVLFPTFAFVFLWALSPALMLWLSQPGETVAGPRLQRRDLLFLRHRARRTWRFFDDLVNQDNHWLPPDNSQLALRVEVAQRTSPTNIGMWLTSALAARDLGYLTADELLIRCSRTLGTLDHLERYEGHFLNWYDTRTLEPLNPRYVSTVDSGNLLISFWVLAQGCRDVLKAPVLGTVCLRGLADTTAIARDICGSDLSVAEPLNELHRLFHGTVEGHALVARLRLASGLVNQLTDERRAPMADDEDRAYWIAHLAAELDRWIGVADRYLRWMETLTYPSDAFLRALGPDVVKLRRRLLFAAPSLSALANPAPGPVDEILARRASPQLTTEAAAWLDQLAAEYAEARANAEQTMLGYETLARDANRFASVINMRFLYDQKRRLFGVGYLVGGPAEFTSHYDLLASECRLASLAAVAKGDVPIEHWLALGRPRAPSGAGPVLLSWSGTMFEYLMPLLFMRSFTGSLIDRACHQAVQRQIEYGREQNLPWGISESAYSALDINQIYQYRAFGVPSLALKRGLEDDRVVSPYSTMLALLVDPEAAIENLKRLETYGLAGPMGLYESIDFSREKKREGERGVVIYTYMAHHQGMSLVALNDVLNRGAMQRRFHSDLRIRAFESLLFERIPISRVPADEVQTSPVPVRKIEHEEPASRTWKEATDFPRVHLNGNGHYALMLTNAGGGYSRWNDFDITRWRSDTTLDPWGNFLYVRDVRAQSIWSIAYQPIGGEQGASSVTFSADQAEFKRRFSAIDTTMHVTVAPEDDAEIRRLTVINRSTRTRVLEFTSYLELSLAPHRADTAHPAFAKMFVETESPQHGVLIAHRRLRSPEDPPIWAAHLLIGAGDEVQCETDRAKFLGRGNTPATAQALRRSLSGTTGAVLDPIFSLRSSATLEPRDRIELTFVTLAAASREALLALIEKYRRPESITRSFEMAWTRSQLAMRYLGVRPVAAHRFHELAGQLLYPREKLRAPASRIARNRLGQSALWTYGISGDLPMLTVTVADERGMALVRELLLAHAYWRLLGFRADLIVLNQEGTSYDRPMHQQLARQIEAHAPTESINKPGGVFLRDWDAMPEDARNLILAVSSVVMSASRGALQQQLVSIAEISVQPPFVAAGNAHEEPSRPLPFLELPYFNGLGGFTKDAHEYAVYLADESTRTPVPWSNVMANPNFGGMVSESGLGCTWSINSQANRLTPWQNDPVRDPQSEVIYLRDDESGAVWTPTALPVREKDPYRARHGAGYTVFEHNSHSVAQELTVFVSPHDPVKVYRLCLKNESSHPRRLTVTYFAEWVLGSVREEQQLHIKTAIDPESGALTASQTWGGTGSGQIAFAASSPRAASWTADRTSFLGRNGNVAKPAALSRATLDKRTGAALDPAAALQVTVNIEPGQSTDVVFLLGQAETIEDVRAIIQRNSNADSKATREFWDATCGALQVRTPVLSVDFLLNRWLIYQVLSCRFWGRTALYQSSGAFGFRDQLQDSMAFLYSAPKLAREHILASAARQFPEGDVQHWWHAETGMGVRTRCSDDLVWLPYAVAHYIEITGDASILDEVVPFIEAPPLAEHEQEHLSTPSVSAQTAPLWDHCRRALEHASKTGVHGLPLIGNGDWNDGLNQVGVEGKGESVWLAWFLSNVLQSFSRVMDKRDPGLASSWLERAADLVAAVERSCWDGDWYLRGFFDDGSPLGSHANEEARIDSIAQSWAVISGAADPDRARAAIASSEKYLVNEADRIVLLFTPPFDHSKPHPGYIMGYPPGVRENGGQYTHGSLWLAMAEARLGNGDGAVRLLQMMNPVEHSRNPESCAAYAGEPYVAAADVSSAPGRAGRTGWTWYTGSAGWMYRIWVEEVLGFKLSGDVLRIEPVIPDSWTHFEITYRHRSAVYEIRVQKSADASITVDGRPSPGVIHLIDDGGTHQVVVKISPGTPSKGSARLLESTPASGSVNKTAAVNGSHAPARAGVDISLQKG